MRIPASTNRPTTGASFLTLSAELRSAVLRHYDGMSRDELLVIIGQAIKNDWVLGTTAASEHAIDQLREWGRLWLERNAVNLVRQLAILNITCSNIPLALRACDAERCVERLTHLGWVPAPLAVTVYAMRHALVCPILNRYMRSRTSPAKK